MAAPSLRSVSDSILLRLDDVLAFDADPANTLTHAQAVEALVEAYVTLKEFELDLAPTAEDDDEDDEDEDDEDEGDDEDEEDDEDDDSESSDARLVLSRR